MFSSVATSDLFFEYSYFMTYLLISSSLARWIKKLYGQYMDPHAVIFPMYVLRGPAISDSNSKHPQVEKVSLNPEKHPQPKTVPAKQAPAKREMSSGGSKEVKLTPTLEFP